MPWSRPDRDAAQRHGASWAIGLSDRCGVAKEKRNLTSTCHGWLIWQGRYPRCPFRYAPTIMGLNGLALSLFAMVGKRIAPSTIKRSLVRPLLCVFRLGLPMARSNDCPFPPYKRNHVRLRKNFAHMDAHAGLLARKRGNSGIRTWEWACRKPPFQGKTKRVGFATLQWFANGVSFPTPIGSPT